ncbi:helix-turn-helix domain-containing protein [Rhodococcus sp. IEGM1428]|uniref:helix-turn-helix domain-containing protein n=1 Tax=Rhodococcus sp. IEGM1428 TaxID=3392191 RepID=UPI003D0EB561
MNIDVHHLILGEFLAASYDVHGGYSPVIAVGGLATLANIEAGLKLSPAEIACCWEYIRRSDVPDGSSECRFNGTACTFRLDTKSISSNGARVGRIARVERVRTGGGLDPAVADSDDPRAPVEHSLDLAIRNQIVKVLDFANGNRVKTASLLGISRSALYRKLTVYGLEWR